jgi:hypothetical protein
MIRAAIPLLLAVLGGNVFAQSPSAKPSDGVHVSGRVTDVQGRELGNVVLNLLPSDSSGKTSALTSIARYDGRISFSGVPPDKYRFSVPGGAFKIIPATVDVGPAGDLELGDVIVQPDVTSDLKLEQIVVDPRVINSSSPWPPANQPPSSTPGSCNVEFEQYRTVEAFLGGKVKAIHVVRFYSPNNSQPAGLQSRILEVWLGVFRSAWCGILWSESTVWGLEASVEYEDGKRGSIMTDGSGHVQVEDREGRFWFFRLWPAAQ